MRTFFRVVKDIGRFQGILSRADYRRFVWQSGVVFLIGFSTLSWGIGFFGPVLWGGLLFTATSRRFQDAGYSGWWSIPSLLFFPLGLLAPYFLPGKKLSEAHAATASAAHFESEFAIEIPAVFRRERALLQKWCEYYRGRQPLLQRMRVELRRINEYELSLSDDLRRCELELEALERAGTATPAEASTAAAQQSLGRRLRQQRKELQSFLERQSQQRQQVEEQLRRREQSLQWELQEWRMLALQLNGFALEDDGVKKGGRDLPKRYRAELEALHQKIRTMEFERSAEQELNEEEWMGGGGLH